MKITNKDLYRIAEMPHESQDLVCIGRLHRNEDEQVVYSLLRKSTDTYYTVTTKYAIMPYSNLVFDMIEDDRLKQVMCEYWKELVSINLTIQV